MKGMKPENENGNDSGRRAAGRRLDRDCQFRQSRRREAGTVVMTNATGFDVAKLLDAVDPAFFASAAKL
jgi:hypothetical protein